MTDITLPPTDLVVFMRRFDTEFWNTGDVAAADDMMAENLIHTFPAGWPVGREGFKKLVLTWRNPSRRFMMSTSSSSWRS